MSAAPAAEPGRIKAALRYAERGILVIPVHSAAGGRCSKDLKDSLDN
jgi:hypothetical protein